MRRSWTWQGMVFQTLPGARSVMPIRSRQEGATSGWMYMRSVRWLARAWLAEVERLASARRDQPVRDVGACAAQEFM